MAGCAPLMKLYCSGMQKPHRKKRFLFVRRTTPRSGGTLRAAFYSACTLILHASHGNVNVHFAQIRSALRSAVCGTRVRAAGLSTEKRGRGGKTGASGAISRLGRDGGPESLSAHRQRGGRIAYPWYAVDSTAFSRAPSNRPCFFRVPARRNRVSSAYRRTDRAFRALSDRLRFSPTPSDGRTEKRRAAGRSCGAAFFSPGQTSFAFLPNSLRISGRSRRGARKQ